MASQTKHYGIIVGVDGSPASDSAVSWAAHDAAMHGVTLTLMHVENPAAPTWAQAPILDNDIRRLRRGRGGSVRPRIRSEAGPSRGQGRRHSRRPPLRQGRLIRGPGLAVG